MKRRNESMKTKRSKQSERIIRTFKEIAERKLETLPTKVRYNFIAELLSLVLEDKRDEAFGLLTAFIEGEYQPSLGESEGKE